MENYVLFEEKRRTAAELVKMIPEGSGVWFDIAVAQPKTIIEMIGRTGKEITAHGLLDLYPAPWFEEGHVSKGVSWFSGKGAMKAVNNGIADVMPCYYRDMPSLLRSRSEVKCLCVSVSPMDENGFFSMGLVNSVSKEMAERAEYIFLEVNRQMPYTFSAPLIHISDVTAFCEADYDLPVTVPSEIDPVSRTIGEIIAHEIPDGATIQLGIGAIPDMVGKALTEKHHLGIHTELFTDSMVELIECGAADNSTKPIHTGKSVTTFAFGSKHMYDFIDHNKDIEILPVGYVNDPKIIALHPKFMSVNSAVEVDLYGQVCAESIGNRHVSGTGGQADYVRGAVESEGGRSFIAFPSTAKGGICSRIRAALSTGAIVTTSKNDVDTIVTEYGMAKLRGKTLSERARALIGIAHPDFRDQLTFEARKTGIIV